MMQQTMERPRNDRLLSRDFQEGEANAAVILFTVNQTEPEYPDSVEFLYVVKFDSQSKQPQFKFPGGTSEEGESAYEAAIREVREETGFILEKRDLELVHTESFQDGHRKFWFLSELETRVKPPRSIGADINLSEPRWAPLEKLWGKIYSTHRTAYEKALKYLYSRHKRFRRVLNNSMQQNPDLWVTLQDLELV